MATIINNNPKKVWIYYNYQGWVKIDLGKVKQLIWKKISANDEGGYDHLWKKWEADEGEGVIKMTYVEYGSNAEGRYEWGGVLVWDGKKTDEEWLEYMERYHIPQIPQDCKSDAAKAHQEKRRKEFIESHADVKIPDWQDYDSYQEEQYNLSLCYQ